MTNLAVSAPVFVCSSVCFNATEKSLLRTKKHASGEAADAYRSIVFAGSPRKANLARLPEACHTFTVS